MAQVLPPCGEIICLGPTDAEYTAGLTDPQTEHGTCLGCDGPVHRNNPASVAHGADPALWWHDDGGGLDHTPNTSAREVTH